MPVPTTSGVLTRTEDTGLTNGSAISSWTDLSGNGRHLTQATPTAQPVVQAGSGVFFDGVNDVLRCDAIAPLISGGVDVEHTVILIAKQSTTTSDRNLFSARSTVPGQGGVISYRVGDLRAKFSYRDDAGLPATTVTATATENTDPHIFTIRKKGKAVAFYVDGVARLDNYTQDSGLLNCNIIGIGASVTSASAASNFFSGWIRAVVVFNKALTHAEMNAWHQYYSDLYSIPFTTLREESVTRVPDAFAGWWIRPRAVKLGEHLYCGGVTTGGAVKVGVFGGTNGGDSIFIDQFTPDDHNNPTVFCPPGKVPIVMTTDHETGKGAGLRWRKGTAVEDFYSLGSIQSKQPSSGADVNYSQLYQGPGSNDLIVFTRVSYSTWHFWKSSDYAATFSASVKLVDFGTGNQMYMTTRQLSDGNLRCVFYGHPTNTVDADRRNLFYCHINLTSGSVTKSDGTVIANINTQVGLPLTILTLEKVYEREAADQGLRLFEVSDGSEIEIAFETWTDLGAGTTPINTMYRYLRRRSDTGAWESRDIVSPGKVFGFIPRTQYVGGMCFPDGTPGGIVYLAREEGDVWTVERRATSNGGSSWSTTVLATSTTGRKLVRPVGLGLNDDFTVTAVDVSRYGVEGELSDFQTYEGDLVALSVPVAAPVITSSSTASGQVLRSFSYQVTASNAPDQYAATGLPAGLAINSVTGLISGVPSTAGTYTVMLTASNDYGDGTLTLTITVSPAPVLRVRALRAGDSAAVVF